MCLGLLERESESNHWRKKNYTSRTVVLSSLTGPPSSDGTLTRLYYTCFNYPLLITVYLVIFSLLKFIKDNVLMIDWKKDEACHASVL